MSKARHHLKDGGKAEKPKINVGRESEEEEEEMEGHKKGGRVHKKHGGGVEHGEGEKPKHHRLDRPGRKRGGGVGANRTPLSTASMTKDAEGHKTGESGEAEGKS